MGVVDAEEVGKIMPCLTFFMVLLPFPATDHIPYDNYRSSAGPMPFPTTSYSSSFGFDGVASQGTAQLHCNNTIADQHSQSFQMSRSYGR